MEGNNNSGSTGSVPSVIADSLSYYNSKLQQEGLPLLAQYISPNKGKGLFLAKQSAAEGEILFREKPLVAIQHVMNRQNAKTCAHCFKFLGSLEHQVQHYRDVILQLEESPKTQMNVPPLQVVPCGLDCGELYCSVECRDEAFAKYHRLLCVGPCTSNKDPLMLFKQHAILQNDLFLLAATAIASVIMEWTRNGRDLNKALQPYVVFHKRMWWDCVDANVSIKELQQIATESITHLRDALMPFVDMHLDECKSPNAAKERQEISVLFTLGCYAQMLGMFEMNDNAIEIPSPLQSILHQLPTMNPTDRDRAWAILEPLVAKIVEIQDLEELEEEHDHMNDEEEMEEEHTEHVHGSKEEVVEVEQTLLQKALSRSFIFTPFEGLGLFPIAAVMNHSCAPNTIVKFQTDYTAQVTALQGIAGGAELTHSYIENDNSFEERAEELQYYGFKCDCPKCIAKV